MKIRTWTRIVSLAAFAGILGPMACGETTLCVPNASVACECPGSAAGAQVCNNDGSAFAACNCDGVATPDGEEGPFDLPGDPAPAGDQPALDPGPGGNGDCSGATTASVSVPWVSQKLASFSSWSGNMCCGPATITMARGFFEGKSVTEDDLKSTIDWMGANIPGWKVSGYKCDPGGTSPETMVKTIHDLTGLNATANTADWCTMVSRLDGNHIVIFRGDAQGTNPSTTFKSGASHWLILDRVEGDFAFVNDPGRNLASQGENRKFTVASVRAHYEADHRVMIVIDKTPDPICPPDCAGKTCGGDSCGGSCGTCVAPSSCTAGVCKSSKCMSTCAQSATQCQGGSTQQTCADYNNDGCVEWGGDQACPGGCSGGACKPTAQCNNGVKDPGEACDGNQLGGATCQSQGYDGGNLTCTNCTFNTSSCCSTTYSVNNFNCPSKSSASPGGQGGGEIFDVCGQVDAGGFVTINAWKHDGTTFGNRPYQVRVSAPGDGPCGPANNFFNPVSINPSGVATNQLSFAFQSNFQAGQTAKEYCVTASTMPGDLGYNAGSAQQQSWWYSQKIGVLKACQ